MDQKLKIKIILYVLDSKPQSLVFYNLNKNEKIKTLNNLHLNITELGNRIIKLNDDEVVVAGLKKVYLIDIKDMNNYQIINEINSDYYNFSILKLSNKLFLTGDEKGTITQYKIENKKIIKDSYKNKTHENYIYSMCIINDNMIISGNGDKNEIKIWKK